MMMGPTMVHAIIASRQLTMRHITSAPISRITLPSTDVTPRT
jgi:hypothetical protein